ncbi:MAG: zinc ribbon domain-containing protein [Chloroflexi bacterium]|nr:zinc ribbon domain-containing protein [Chloroflexota bacterium]
MTCRACGHENPGDVSFCAECGARLASPLAAPYRPFEESETSSIGVESLPPRDLGQLLSETARVYRENFWLFAGIAVVPEVFFLLATLAPLPASVLFIIIGVVASIFAAAASAYAVRQRYLGRDIDPAASYSRALSRAVPLIVALIILSAVLILCALLSLILIGIPLFFFFLVSWFFVDQVIMLENTEAGDAFRRSRALVQGSWWRVFGIGLVYLVILMALLFIGLIPIGLFSQVGPSVGEAVSTIWSTLLAPILHIGATLVYFDLRVRKEQFNLSQMAAETAA